jgi:S-adenosylmethionine:diacylglycerol 3-amino-3-carboxypropyl transferase
MHEDAALDMEQHHGRIVCVASAGDTAMALAAVPGNHVTAVDLNEAQIRYVRERLAGGRVRGGTADRLMDLGRGLVGWRRDQLADFLELDDVDEQAAVWRRTFETPRFRASFAVLVGPLGLVLGEHSVRMDIAIRRRLARGWASHPNRTNPYAPLLLLGIRPEVSRPTEPMGAAAGLELVTSDAATYLEGVAPGSVDGFSLSNILDAAGRAYGGRLVEAVRRAAAPGATLVLRSFAEPRTRREDELATHDRAHIWGRILVGSPADLAAW